MQVRSLPVVTRIYQNHSLDSTRWSGFSLRAGDVVVASSYKSGTTWVQMIVLRLLRPEGVVPAIMEESPWLESPMLALDAAFARLDAQRGRRVIKTHLPLDGLPLSLAAKYIVVCRDPRDTFMSLWNHYRNLIRYPFQRLRMHPARVGGPLPRCPDDIREAWCDWTTRGWFSWETEGYPFWGNLRHTRTWWEWRHLPNLLFVHYSDLLDDLPSQVNRIAKHLEVDIDDARSTEVVQSATFESMRQRRDALLPAAGSMFVGGAQTFLYSGTNGRWKTVLRDRDLDLYEEAAGRELHSECRVWLERAY